MKNTLQSRINSWLDEDWEEQFSKNMFDGKNTLN